MPRVFNISEHLILFVRNVFIDISLEHI